MKKKKYRIKMDINEGGEWYWILQSGGNYKTLAPSEGYSSKQQCLDTAEPLAVALGCPLVEKA